MCRTCKNHNLWFLDLVLVHFFFQFSKLLSAFTVHILFCSAQLTLMCRYGWIVESSSLSLYCDDRCSTTDRVGFGWRGAPETDSLHHQTKRVWVLGVNLSAFYVLTFRLLLSIGKRCWSYWTTVQKRTGRFYLSYMWNGYEIYLCFH